MLHGIYGRGRNWQAIAKGVVASRPEYGCWLVDLPYHGASPPASHGDSVSGLAQDVREWLDAQAVTAKRDSRPLIRRQGRARDGRSSGRAPGCKYG